MKAVEKDNQHREFPARGIRWEVEITGSGNSGVSDE
jgi:hypothetical protein